MSILSGIPPNAKGMDWAAWEKSIPFMEQVMRQCEAYYRALDQEGKDPWINKQPIKRAKNG